MNLAIFWHRRDLRLDDNAGLYHALKSGLTVLPIFIFDTNILDKLQNKNDARVSFIHQSLNKLKTEYEKLGSSLLILHGKPLDVYKKLLNQYDIKAVFTNRDYEPYAQERDKEIYTFLQSKGVVFKGYKDHVIFEKSEIIKDDGKPYTVFTPYSRKWKAKLNPFYLKAYPTSKYTYNLLKTNPLNFPSLKQIGFNPSPVNFPEKNVNTDLIRNYHQTRDFPGINGTSKLSVHLRFGTISIRALAQTALKNNETFLNELIWRDFYSSILYHFPHVVKSSFKKEYDSIPWINNENQFLAWCNGQTGYPIVDAGMRELNTTGFMHNRVRMITASFLTKHLLIDWRWGEAYFASKLLDFDLASNNGGWQWAASSGCDAAPYFRIFNPYEQTKKFDPKYDYIQKWIPELNTINYPKPIVEHAFARARAIEVYSKVLKKS